MIARLTGDKKRARLIALLRAAGASRTPARRPSACACWDVISRRSSPGTAASRTRSSATCAIPATRRNSGSRTSIPARSSISRRSSRPCPPCVTVLVCLVLSAAALSDPAPCSRAPSRRVTSRSIQIRRVRSGPTRRACWPRRPGRRADSGPAHRDRSRWTKEHLYLLYHLSVRRAEPQAGSRSRRGNAAALELGRRRGVHRLGLRAHRPLQGVPGLAAK